MDGGNNTDVNTILLCEETGIASRKVAVSSSK
jgi:hypothetical protein